MNTNQPTTTTTDETLTDHPEWTTQWDDETTFPFVEDENANITGYGHQDPDTFAAEVNRYDAMCTGEAVAEDDLWTGDHISHAWVTVDPDGEHLHVCTADTPGAIPVTSLWGQR